jgi:hypothetical protein
MGARSRSRLTTGWPRRRLKRERSSVKVTALPGDGMLGPELKERRRGRLWT